MTKGLPFCDNSVRKIKCESVLEHIGPVEDFVFLMNECLRVLVPNGTMYIQVPHWKGQPAFKDPTHCRFFDEDTFTYLEKENKWDYGFDKRWRIIEMQNIFNSTLKVSLRAEK